jgi:hypothetical protein
LILFKNKTDEVLLELGTNSRCPTDPIPPDIALDDWDKPPK